MNQMPPLSPSGEPDSARRPQPGMRRRKLDITRIKVVIVFVAGLITALGSALSGIGAHIPFMPMLTWMLGFGPEKSLATAMRYAVFVALGVVIGLYGASAAPANYPLHGFLLLFGSTVGAILAAKTLPQPGTPARRQIMQTLGIGLAFFTMVQAFRLTPLVPSAAVAQWDAWWQLGLIGVVTGVVAHVTWLPGSILLVPSLYFLGGLSVVQAIALTALMTMGSILPVWSYAKKGWIDLNYGNPAAIGGFLGGLAGGFLLPRLTDKSALLLFGFLAMYLCAREVMKITLERTPVQGGGS